MGETNSCGPEGFSPSELVCKAPTPGSLGVNDYADPDVPWCLGDSPGPVGHCDHAEPTAVAQSPQSQDERDVAAGQSVLDKIFREVDSSPELKGAGIVLVLPGAEPLQCRKSDHPSTLETWVVFELQVTGPEAERTWWESWNGIILNCGGAAISWAGVGLSAAAEIPSAGTSTAVLVVSYAAATATTTQCGLAIAKETSDDFGEYVQSADGQWINSLDMALDVVSLFGGAAGAVKAVKGGSRLLKTSKYANELSKIPKGTLLKQLERLKKLDEDLSYFRAAVDQAIRSRKVLDPAARVFSNNLLKRTLPFITKSLQREKLASLADVVATAFSTTSSYYGGVGSEARGLVKTTIRVFQQSALKGQGDHLPPRGSPERSYK
ncbi:MAG: hypothetical protein H6832_03245 [Planctomycetes bacterium]|nr:hypothetical protein [Planctomycetota bacterium]